MSKFVTLNLTIEKMRTLSEIVQREIAETEHLLSPSPTLDELLKDRRNILAGIEAAIIHAELE